MAFTWQLCRFALAHSLLSARKIEKWLEDSYVFSTHPNESFKNVIVLKWHQFHVCGIGVWNLWLKGSQHRLFWRRSLNIIPEKTHWYLQIPYNIILHKLVHCLIGQLPLKAFAWDYADTGSSDQTDTNSLPTLLPHSGNDTSPAPTQPAHPVGTGGYEGAALPPPPGQRGNQYKSINVGVNINDGHL